MKVNNRVELLDFFGGDDNHVNVARVSYGKEASNYTEEQNSRLLKYLVNHGHTSPFRHSQLQFRISCPIYVERQLFKHQVGISVNSISGRYVDFSDSYYEIEQFRTQSKDSKQGSGEDLSQKKNDIAKKIQSDVIEYCKWAYESMIFHGVSKEQARSVLPLSLETEFIWTGSFLAFVHLCNLRLKEDTQKETRDIVTEMLRQVKGLDNFKETVKAFGL
jgi:thymidylate synthase (FAD)